MMRMGIMELLFLLFLNDSLQIGDSPFVIFDTIFVRIDGITMDILGDDIKIMLHVPFRRFDLADNFILPSFIRRVQFLDLRNNTLNELLDITFRERSGRCAVLLVLPGHAAIVQNQ